MATEVDVLVPWRGGCADREAAWRWVSARYGEGHPDWPLRVGIPVGARWVKAEAITAAAEASEAEILVIADADVWCDGLAAAVAAVEGGAAWAVPHELVYRLDRLATEAVLAGNEPDRHLPLVQDPYRGVAGGGIVVLPRLTALEIPMDRRYVGWGQADTSWGIALKTLYGPSWRGTAPLWHLFHPPQDRLDRKWGSHASKQLRRRYGRARRDVAQMRALLDETKEAGR